MALIVCPECGGTVSDKAKICVHCGYPLIPESEEAVSFLFCPYCGHKIIGEASFCPDCGKKIHGDGVSAASPFAAASEHPTSIMAYAAPSAGSSGGRSDEPKCPVCGSRSLSVGKRGIKVGRAAIGGIVAGPIGMLAGGVGMNDTVITCLKCGHMFTPDGKALR